MCQRLSPYTSGRTAERLEQLAAGGKVALVVLGAYMGRRLYCECSVL